MAEVEVLKLERDAAQNALDYLFLVTLPHIFLLCPALFHFPSLSP